MITEDMLEMMQNVRIPAAHSPRRPSRLVGQWVRVELKPGESIDLAEIIRKSHPFKPE